MIFLINNVVSNVILSKTIGVKYLNSIIHVLLVNDDISLDKAYKIVSTNNHTNINSVKKNISYVIRINWSTIKNNNKINIKYKSQPNNKEFICLLTEYIKKEFYYK